MSNLITTVEPTMFFRFVFTLFTFTFLIFTASVAQPRGDRGAEQLKRITEKVGLTADQAAKVKDLMQKARDEMRAEFENNSGDRESMRELMMKRTEKTDAEIMKLLTKEQLPKYEAFKKEREKERQERMRERQ